MLKLLGVYCTVMTINVFINNVITVLYHKSISYFNKTEISSGRSTKMHKAHGQRSRTMSEKKLENNFKKSRGYGSGTIFSEIKANSYQQRLS